MKTHTKTLFTALAASALLAGSASAATITEYTFASNTSATTEATNTSSSNFAAAAGIDDSGRSTNSGGSFFTRNGNTTFDQNSGYIGFTVTIDPGFELDLTDLSFNYSNNDAQPVRDSAFISTYSVRTSADSFASDLTGTYSTNPLTADQTFLDETASFDLTSLGNVSGTFEVRVYATLSSGNFEWLNRYDNVLLEGEVVPEPSSLALLGLGGLLIARRRRG